jgi:hypothetical protein
MSHAQKPVFVLRLNGRVHVYLQEVTVQSAVGTQGVHVYFQCAVELRRLCSAFLRTLVATHFILLFLYNFLRRHSLCQDIVLVVFFLLTEVFGFLQNASIGRTKRVGFVVSAIARSHCCRPQPLVPAEGHSSFEKSQHAG